MLLLLTLLLPLLLLLRPLGGGREFERPREELA